MRPWQRAGLSAGAVLLILVLAFAIHTLIAFGTFTSVTPGFAGTCRKVGPVAGPEDIAIDAQSGFAFISAMDRRAAAAGHWSAKDGIYGMVVRTTDVRKDIKPGEFVLTPLFDARWQVPVRLSGTPTDFHPHGISLYRDAAGLELLAINHRSDGTNSVEAFDVAIQNGAAVLHHSGAIESRVLVSPNAIVAVDRARFYIGNDHGSTTKLGRWLDDVAVLPRANILYFNGLVFRTVAEHMTFPSGLALSPDGHFLYATEAYARRLDAFKVEPVSGSLDQAGTLDIPSDLDNLRFDDAGYLWVGSHPKAFGMAAFRADPHKPAPSEVFKVTIADGVPQSAAAVYANDGGEIGGSSVAAVLGNRVLIGSPLDDHILDCRL